MNADDVLWSIQRINDKQHPAHAAAANGFPCWAGMSMPSLLNMVEKLGEMRVRFNLTRPEAPFLADLTMSALATVYSAEYGEQLRAAGKLVELNNQPVGTGPYQLKSYQKDAVIRYVPHAGYWGPKPALDQLVFTITLDNSARLPRLKAGECMVGDLPAENQEALKADARFATVVSKPLTTTYLAPNSRHKFLSDPRFRKALSMAIDRAQPGGGGGPIAGHDRALHAETDQGMPAPQFPFSTGRENCHRSFRCDTVLKNTDGFVVLAGRKPQ
jgi:dipeptide transport system substrate-binding protein